MGRAVATDDVPLILLIGALLLQPPYVTVRSFLGA